MKLKTILKNNKFYLYVLLAIVTSSLTTYSSYLVGDMVQFAVNKELNRFINLSIMTAILYILGASISYFRTLISEKYIQEIALKLRQTAIFSFKKEYISNEHKNNGSKYFNMIVSDVQYFEEHFKNVIGTVNQSIKLIIVTIFLININYRVIIVVFILGIIMTVVPGFFHSKLIKDTENISGSTEKFSKNLDNYINSASALKNANALSLFNKIINRSSKEISDGKINRTKSSTKFDVVIIILNILNQIFLMSFSAYLAYKEIISFGMIFAVSSLSGEFFASMSILLGVFPSYSYVKGILNKFSANETDVKEDLERKVNFEKEITVTNLQYNYSEKTLQFPNITIRKNKKYVIIGESGSGKSTLLNILNGNFRNYSGMVKIDEHSYDSLKYEELTNTIATMEQTVHILNTSIKENIILNKFFDERRFSTIIEKTNLKSVINALPEKENTILDSSNSVLSGGQLQRIALARTLYQGTKIILIDEGTANLDKETANEIESILFNDKDLTVVMITHHLTDHIRNLADEIITL